jgi:hypothetical protein
MMMEQRNAKIWSVVSIPQQGNIALTLILGLAIDLFVLICCPLTLWFDFFFEKLQWKLSSYFISRARGNTEKGTTTTENKNYSKFWDI